MEDKIKPFSIHTFMYPFHLGSDKQMSDIADSLTKNKWERKQFKLDSNIQYNEFAYFHPFVQKSLYDFEDNRRINYLEYPISNDSFFEFEAKDYEKDFVIRLNLKGISIHLFFTGVGILTFQLENNQCGDVEFIKFINDYGRRTYPQFLGEDGVASTKKQFLPEFIKVKYNDKTQAIDTFDKYVLPIANFEDAIQLPKYIDCLLPNEIKKILVPLNDDRMFTICWYGNNTLSEELSKQNSSGDYTYLSSEEWYSLIFCDKRDSTCQSKTMLNEHLKKYTYDRWVNYGTLYGITRDCLFTLTSEWENLIKAHADYLPSNNKTVYYQLAVICLAQRASINKFSCELSSICCEQNDAKKRKQALNLHNQYIKFNNVLYFKEVTSQIQGIEMYQMMHEAMNIEKEANQLDREIEEFNSFIEMENNNQVSENMLTLTKIATWFIPASAIAAVFALFYNDIGSPFSYCKGGIILLLVAIIFYFALLSIIKKRINYKAKK